MTTRIHPLILATLVSITAHAQGHKPLGGGKDRLPVIRAVTHLLCTDDGIQSIKAGDGGEDGGQTVSSGQNPATILGLAPDDGLYTGEETDTFPEVEPLISTKWGYGYPYNRHIPGNRSVGSLGVAVAQLMRYHRFPDDCGGCPGYQGDLSGHDVDSLPATSFRWECMPDSLGTSSTDEETEAVAELMRYAAQAVLTDFYFQAGASFPAVPLALANYMGYSPGMRVMSRVNEGVDDWYAVLHENLETGNPVAYFAATLGGGTAFIIDGYRRGGLFHINWGRGGLYDGWYRLQRLDAFGKDEYSILFLSQSMVAGIKPADGTEHVQEDARLESLFLDAWNRTYTLDGGYYYKDIPITYELENSLRDIRDMDCGLALFLGDSLVLAIDSVCCPQMRPGTLLREAQVSIRYTIKDGDYTVRTVSRPHGEGPWETCRHNGVFDLGIRVDKHTLTTTLRRFPGKEIRTNGIYFIGKSKERDGYDYCFDITNDGPDYSGEIFIWYMFGYGYPEVVPGFLEIRKGERRSVPFWLPVRGEDCYCFVTPVCNQFYDPIIYGAVQDVDSCHGMEIDGGKDSRAYDLQGRRMLSAPTKGLYIQNGKKYLVR